MKSFKGASAALALSLAVLGTLAVSAPAQAASWSPEQDGYGLCLDDTGYSTQAGNQMQVWTCNGKAPQGWTVYASRTDPPTGAVEVMIEVQQSGMCLDQYQGKQGPVVQWPCHKGDNAQWWFPIYSGGGPGWDNLASAASGDWLQGPALAGEKVYTANVMPSPPGNSRGFSWYGPASV